MAGTAAYIAMVQPEAGAKLAKAIADLRIPKPQT